MPFLLKFSVLWVLFFVPVVLQAQVTDYTLTGKINVKGGSSYRYQLVFSSKKGIVHGYSFTWIQGNKPNKAIITGVMDVGKRTLSFCETKMVTKTGPDDMCLVQGKLSYDKKGAFFFFKGPFQGKDNAGGFCGQGDIILSGSAGAGKQKNTKVIIDSVSGLPYNALLWPVVSNRTNI